MIPYQQQYQQMPQMQNPQQLQQMQHIQQVPQAFYQPVQYQQPLYVQQPHPMQMQQYRQMQPQINSSSRYDTPQPQQQPQQQQHVEQPQPKQSNTRQNQGKIHYYEGHTLPLLCTPDRVEVLDNTGPYTKREVELNGGKFRDINFQIHDKEITFVTPDDLYVNVKEPIEGNVLSSKRTYGLIYPGIYNVRGFSNIDNMLLSMADIETKMPVVKDYINKEVTSILNFLIAAKYELTTHISNIVEDANKLADHIDTIKRVKTRDKYNMCLTMVANYLNLWVFDIGKLIVNEECYCIVNDSLYQILSPTKGKDYCVTKESFESFYNILNVISPDIKDFTTLYIYGPGLPIKVYASKTPYNTVAIKAN